MIRNGSEIRLVNFGLNASQKCTAVDVETPLFNCQTLTILTLLEKIKGLFNTIAKEVQW